MLAEISPKSMKTKKRPDLFFRSDVLDAADYVESMAGRFEQSDRFLKAVAQEIDTVLTRREHLYAPATSDVVNSWARELGLPETKTSNDMDVRDAVDRIWSYVSTRLFSSKPCVDPKTFNQAHGLREFPDTTRIEHCRENG